MTNPIAHLGLIDEEDLQLDAAALELAALDHPERDLADHVALLSAMTARVAELGGAAQTSMGRALALADVIGDEYGFAGDRATYDDPANADMIRVIDRRRGLPVSLSILYVAIARRVGWAADALNTPGHVLIRIGADAATVLIDPFNRGRRVDGEQLEALVAQMAGAGPVATEHVAPMPNRAVLTRLLLNQATRADAAGDAERARTLYERINAFAPADANAWWQRARLALACGDLDDARGSLTGLLEMTRDPALRERVLETMERIAAS